MDVIADEEERGRYTGFGQCVSGGALWADMAEQMVPELETMAGLKACFRVLSFWYLFHRR